MKCTNCNRDINVKDMQFCPYCGSKINNSDITKEYKDANAQIDIVEIGINKIKINNYKCMECRELIALLSLAETLAKKIESLYNEAGSLDKATSVLRGVISDMYPKFCKKILDINSFEIDATGDELYTLSSEYIHSLNDIVSLSEAKIMNLDYKDAYNQFNRYINKESRFKVIGGGFGLEGALKGMAVAGAFNLTTGALYSMFNAPKSFIDKVSFVRDKRFLYSKLKKKVYMAVYNDVIQTYYFLNYQIERPMFYKLCNEDINELFNEEKKQVGKRGAALRLIIKYPYRYDSFRKAAEIIEADNGLLNYAKKVGNTNAESYLETKKEANVYLKKDTIGYMNLFIGKPFFYKAISKRTNVVDGVVELCVDIKKYLIVKPNYSQILHEIDDNEFVVCCFFLKNLSLLCTNKKIYFDSKKESLYFLYSNLSYAKYNMIDLNETEICINEGLTGTIKFNEKFNESEAKNFVDCINYIILKIKYNIPKVFPDNIATINDNYRNKLYKILGEETEHLIKRYKRYHALDMFLKYGDEDIIDVLKKDMKIKFSELGCLPIKIANDIESHLKHPSIIEDLIPWISKYGYSFNEQKIICYVRGYHGMNMMLTATGIYFKVYDNDELHYLHYKDIYNFRYKYVNLTPVYLINNTLQVHISMWGLRETEGEIIYQWILYIILNFKYVKNIKHQCTLNLDGYKDFFREYMENLKKQEEKGKEKEEDDGCFITTATCLALGKGDNCYELNAFRHFRDEWLSKENDGKQLIDEYYNIAPIIVSNINHDLNRISIYENIWEQYLKSCLADIEKKEYQSCKSKYISMVKKLRKLFGQIL